MRHARIGHTHTTARKKTNASTNSTSPIETMSGAPDDLVADIAAL
jgi:hypothetical protein